MGRNDMNHPQNSRAMAAHLVQRWLSQREMPERMLESIEHNRGFITELVLGVVRKERSLEWIASQLATSRPGPDMLACLMVGLYQLFYLDDVEPYASVNETVAAAKAIGGQRRANFVNAILRRALREQNQLQSALRTCPLPIRCSHPDDLVERWLRHFGAEATEALCQWNNLRPDLIIRVRPVTTAADLHLSLSAAGIAARLHAIPDYLVLPPGTRPHECPGYQEGHFIVQDPATRLAIDLLNPQPTEQILDSCAAPGGKTIAIADRMGTGASEGTGALVARDVNTSRLQVVKENLARCGVAGVRIEVADGTATVDEALFDGILLDVPCSNTGVIRRRPDVRVRINEKHLQQLMALQSQLLDQAARQTNVGGRVIYSTCSLEPEENEGQVTGWLARHPNFALEGQVRSFPPQDGIDGAYAAKLVRRV
jgi:16S rRNA (cytosine967-C5)-methyltransferase